MNARSNTLKRNKERSGKDQKPRRDFLEILTLGFAGVGGAVFVWPFIDTMNPARDVLAASSIEFSLAGIEEGQSVTTVWRGKPLFVRHRTAQEIAEAQNAKAADLIDPEEDAKRASNPKWLVVVGICTHLGCVPLGNEPGQQKGEFGGWFCPCHGSQYDTSGRVRRGPAPTNLSVPPYTFINDTLIKVG